MEAEGVDEGANGRDVVEQIPVQSISPHCGGSIHNDTNTGGYAIGGSIHNGIQLVTKRHECRRHSAIYLRLLSNTVPRLTTVTHNCQNM